MKKMKLITKRWISIVLAFSLIFSWLPASAGAVEFHEGLSTEDIENRTEDIKGEVEQSLDNTKKYYENNPTDYSEDKGSHSDYWEFAALWGSGYKDLKNDFPWTDSNPWSDHTYWSLGKEEPANMSKEDMGIIIGSLLIGNDPQKFGERNAIEDLLEKQKDDGMFSDLFGEPWALIALELVDADYDKDEYIQALLEKQSDGGAFGATDSTGWMMTALAPYMDENPDVKEAVDQSIEWAHNSFLENDEFPGMMGTNANSTSAIIMGLAAAGEDLSSEKWIKEDGSLVGQLLDYQQDDGSFWWKKDSSGVVRMVTEQALLAIATVVNGQSIFIDLKDHVQENLFAETEVSLRVEGIHETVYVTDTFDVHTIGDDVTAFDATEQALNEAGIPFEGDATYISKIGDEEEATFGGWDGWQYMVNDVYPDVSVGDYLIKDGDEIVWFYGNVGDIYKGVDVADEVDKLTLIPKFSLPSNLYENEELEVTITSTYDIYDENFVLEEENVPTVIKDAHVHFNGKTYPTDEDGVARIPANEVMAGEYEVRVTKDVDDSYPRLLRDSKKVSIEEQPAPEQEIPYDEETEVKPGHKIVIDNSKSEIILPDNLPEGTTLKVSIPDEKDVPYENEGLQLVGDLFDFNFMYPKGSEAFKGKFQLTLGVDDFIDIDRAEIYYFDEASNTWKRLEGIKDKENRTITVEVEHFSVYGVFIASDDADDGENDGSEGNNGESDDTDQGKGSGDSDDTDDQDTDTPKKENDEDGLGSKKIEEQKEAGSQLPKTATNSYNLLLIGFLLLSLGAITFIVLKRRGIGVK